MIFKPGDRVIVVDPFEPYLPLGSVGTVVQCSSHVWVRLDDNSNSEAMGGWLPWHFDLLTHQTVRSYGRAIQFEE